MIRAALILTLALTQSATADTLSAARVVRPNTIIQPEDIAIAATPVPGALSAEFDIVGLEAKITLYPGRPIRPEHVGSPALVERNQPVTVVYHQNGLMIATDARALSRGAAGDVVRVMNLSSRTTVSGKVQPDGSVLISRGEHGR